VSYDQQKEWEKLLEDRGRIPYIQYPVICAKCGELWPEFFHVPTNEWEYYIQPDMRDKVLCRKCYNFIVKVINEGTK